MPALPWPLGLISCHFPLLAECWADISSPHLGDKPSSSNSAFALCLLAKLYSSFQAQCKCHPFSNAGTSDPGQNCNSFLCALHCTRSLIPEITPLGAGGVLQAEHCGGSLSNPSSASSFKFVLSSRDGLPSLGSCQSWLSSALYYPDPHHCLVNPGERISTLLKQSTILCT